MQVYIINRGVDVDRRKRALESFGGVPGLSLDIVEAIDGHAPEFDPARQWLRLAAPTKASTFACFLSHALAWRRIAAGSAAALVLEDDAAPLDGAADRFGEVGKASADLVYVNLRASQYARLAGVTGLCAVHEVYRRNQTENSDKAEYFALGRGTLPPPGGDGYLLSPKAAARLVRAAERHGALGHVDWFLFACCAQGQDLPPERQMRFVREMRAHYGSLKLDGLILRPPLVDQGQVPSVRRAEKSS